MTPDLDCCYCPARHFPNRTKLNEHQEQHRLAELASRPCDPHVLLREALVWAEDAGALRAFDDYERGLLDVARLEPGKPIPGYPASLFGAFDGLAIRVAIADRASGPGLVVHLFYGDETSITLRRPLPAMFAAPKHNTTLRDSRAIAERFEAANAAGLRAEGDAA